MFSERNFNQGPIQLSSFCYIKPRKSHFQFGTRWQKMINKVFNRRSQKCYLVDYVPFSSVFSQTHSCLSKLHCYTFINFKCKSIFQDKTRRDRTYSKNLQTDETQKLLIIYWNCLNQVKWKSNILLWGTWTLHTPSERRGGLSRQFGDVALGTVEMYINNSANRIVKISPAPSDQRYDRYQEVHMRY